MPQPYFVKGLIGKVLAYGGLQIRKYIPHGLQPTNERRAESKLAYAMPSKEEEDDSQIHADKKFNENNNENEDQYLIADKLFACC